MKKPLCIRDIKIPETKLFFGKQYFDDFSNSDCTDDCEIKCGLEFGKVTGYEDQIEIMSRLGYVPLNFLELQYRIIQSPFIGSLKKEAGEYASGGIVTSSICIPGVNKQGIEKIIVLHNIDRNKFQRPRDSSTNREYDYRCASEDQFYKLLEQENKKDIFVVDLQKMKKAQENCFDGSYVDDTYIRSHTSFDERFKDLVDINSKRRLIGKAKYIIRKIKKQLKSRKNNLFIYYALQDPFICAVMGGYERTKRYMNFLQELGFESFDMVSSPFPLPRESSSLEYRTLFRLGIRPLNGLTGYTGDFNMMSISGKQKQTVSNN